MSTQTSEPPVTTAAPTRPPQILTDLLVHCGRAQAGARMRGIDALMLECAALGMTQDAMDHALRTTLLHRHDYETEDGKYDTDLLDADLNITGRNLDRMYSNALQACRPGTPEEAEGLRRRLEQRATERQAIEAQMASMPPIDQLRFTRLDDAEKEQARTATYRMQSNGHSPRSSFRHCLGTEPLLANSCGRCGRWIAVSTKTRKLSGSALAEKCQTAAGKETRER